MGAGAGVCGVDEERRGTEDRKEEAEAAAEESTGERRSESDDAGFIAEYADCCADCWVEWTEGGIQSSKGAIGSGVSQNIEPTMSTYSGQSLGLGTKWADHMCAKGT
jgi:hypothetical protein